MLKVVVDTNIFSLAYERYTNNGDHNDYYESYLYSPFRRKIHKAFAVHVQLNRHVQARPSSLTQYHVYGALSGYDIHCNR